MLVPQHLSTKLLVPRHLCNFSEKSLWPWGEAFLVGQRAAVIRQSQMTIIGIIVCVDLLDFFLKVRKFILFDKHTNVHIHLWVPRTKRNLKKQTPELHMGKVDCHLKLQPAPDCIPKFNAPYFYTDPTIGLLVFLRASY